MLLRENILLLRNPNPLSKIYSLKRHVFNDDVFVVYII